MTCQQLHGTLRTAQQMVGRLIVGRTVEIPGPEGPPGPQGPQGIPGPPGPAGADAIDEDALTVGESIYPRRAAVGTLSAGASGRLNLSYWTANQDMTVSRVLMCVVGAAAAGAAKAQIGVYAVNSVTGDLTLVGISVDDPTRFDTANSRVIAPLVAAYSQLAGQRYALAQLVQTGAALPTFVANMVPATVSSADPRISGILSGQSDLPPTILGSAVANASGIMYGEVLPP